MYTCTFHAHDKLNLSSHFDKYHHALLIYVHNVCGMTLTSKQTCCMRGNLDKLKQIVCAVIALDSFLSDATNPNII